MAEITTIEALRAHMGDAHELTQAKITDGLFEEARDFIARAPLIMIATVSKDGLPTVSPKGDAPGFVAIKDDKTLLIPERPGNRLCHGLTNVIDTGTIGLIFLIPGQEETLRVTGRAVIKDDADLCARFEARGKPALLVQEVTIETCFFHCAKAFKRSQTWNPESWGEPLKISFGDIIARLAGKKGVTKFAMGKAVDLSVKADYKTNL